MVRVKIQGALQHLDTIAGLSFCMVAYDRACFSLLHAWFLQE